MSLSQGSSFSLLCLSTQNAARTETARCEADTHSFLRLLLEHFSWPRFASSVGSPVLPCA